MRPSALPLMARLTSEPTKGKGPLFSWQTNQTRRPDSRGMKSDSALAQIQRERKLAAAGHVDGGRGHVHLTRGVTTGSEA